VVPSLTASDEGSHTSADGVPPPPGRNRRPQERREDDLEYNAPDSRVDVEHEDHLLDLL
jgi:hypothetical protein